MSFTNAKIIGTGVTPADYLADKCERGTPEFRVSSSALRMFAHCPERWKLGYEPPVSEAKEFGSLLDCLLLTPGQMEKRYAIVPARYPSKGMQCPKCLSVTDSAKCKSCKTERVEIAIEKDWNWNSTACQLWAEERKGLEFASAKDMAEALTAVRRIQGDPILNSFLECSDRQVWVAADWQDEPTGITIPCKCLIDLAPRKDSEFSGALADLKTTRTAAVLPWNRDCFKYGYFVQGAWDLDLYRAATGEDRTDWCFLLIESYPPFQFGRRLLSQDFLALGRAEYQRLIGNYAACVKASRWPAYDDTDESIQGGWSLCQPDPWMAERAAFAPKFDFDDAPEDEAPTDEEPIGITP